MPTPASRRSRRSARSQRHSPTWSARSATRRCTTGRRVCGRDSTRGRTCSSMAFAPGAAEAILEHLETSTAQMAAAQLRVLGGAMARVPDGATAFGHRGAKMMVNIAAIYESPDERPEHEAWVGSLATALSDGTSAAYVGFIGNDGDQGVRRARLMNLAMGKKAELS